jgi:hypothetical protein
MRYLILLTILSFTTVAGCSSRDPETKPVASPSTAKHDHKHDADAADDDDDEHAPNVAHAGPYHAKLTFHLSAKDGNEMDLHFETVGKKPYALTFDKLTAKAKREGDEKEYDVTFEPAPADERPKDEKPGTCSHYVAKAPFLKDTDTVTVTMKVVIRERERTVRWQNFEVKKYGHKHE